MKRNIFSIYKAKPYLNKDSLLALYLSYILSYINYANLVWGSTHRTYLRKINSQQKHTLRLIHNKNRFYHSIELFEYCAILNVYKLNLLNPLSANPEKWSNTLKQIVGNLPTICLSVFDHFMNLALKGLILRFSCIK